MKRKLFFFAISCFVALAGCSTEDVGELDYNISKPIVIVPQDTISNNIDKGDKEQKKMKVIIIGSSIAQGVGASDYANSWVGTLQSVSQDSIINNSKSGYLTFHFLPETLPNKAGIVSDLSRNITASLKLNPDLIIFSITTNDVANGFTADQYMANMKIMTDLCEVNHVLFLIGSTTPRPLNLEGKMALIEINNRMKNVYGDDRFVNYYQELVDLKTLEFKSVYNSGDNLHPNNKGHKVIFDAFYPFYLKMKNRR